ncbi:hypothetical protein BDB01DRAFT_840368 [Pilobolus umbonatus]|nr:hypothetical protein BDB01DRAFT_840368 [Pilobolus umbonatus]
MHHSLCDTITSASYYLLSEIHQPTRFIIFIGHPILFAVSMTLSFSIETVFVIPCCCLYLASIIVVYMVVDVADIGIETISLLTREIHLILTRGSNIHTQLKIIPSSADETPLADIILIWNYIPPIEECQVDGDMYRVEISKSAFGNDYPHYSSYKHSERGYDL